MKYTFLAAVCPPYLLKSWLSSVVFDQASSNSENTLGLDDFQLLRVIGRGSYAKVLQVEHKRTKRIYAMKVIKKELVNDDEVGNKLYSLKWNGGDGLAQWLERWTGDPKVEGSNPVRSTTKNKFLWVNKVVLTRCRCAQPPCVYCYIIMDCTALRLSDKSTALIWPDMTFAVDWALKNNSLSIYLLCKWWSWMKRMVPCNQMLVVFACILV